MSTRANNLFMDPETKTTKDAMAVIIPTNLRVNNLQNNREQSLHHVSIA